MRGRGFRFGMILQFAVGPVCLFIFQQSVYNGLLPALAGVAAVTLVDGLFIILSLLGLSLLVQKHTRFLNLAGALVLAAFGLKTIIEAACLLLNPDTVNQVAAHIPDAAAPTVTLGAGFLSAFVLTASNPLTIVFWAGVFSGKMSELTRSQQLGFGLGAILSTMTFLGIISVAGQLTSQFLPRFIILLLNLGVGIIICGFAVAMILKKKHGDT